MRDFRDAKAMAQTLREALKARFVSVTHSESLELVSKVLGFHDWNVLSARIQAEQGSPAAKSSEARAEVRLLPTLPLRDIVLFPRMTVPLFVGRDSSRQAVERAMAGDKRILAVTQKRAADDNPAPDGLYGVGVTANIIHLTTFADGTIRLIAEGLERATVLRLAEGQSLGARFLETEVAPIEESRGQEAEAVSLIRPVLEKFQVYRNASLSSPPYFHLPHIREPGVLADAVVPLLSVDIATRQDLLETSDVIARLEKIGALMETDRQAA
jgi:ATP-dependent Lon protease